MKLCTLTEKIQVIIWALNNFVWCFTDKAKDKKNSTLITLPSKNDCLTKVEGQPKGEKEKNPDNEAIEVKVCKSQADEINIHPLDATIHLSVHQKLLPPGKIIHIVRHYQRNPR